MESEVIQRLKKNSQLYNYEKQNKKKKKRKNKY